VELFVQTFLNGLLQSGIYALVATGLALAVGVVGIVNFAHGEFLMVGTFISYALLTALGIDPIFGFFVAAAVMFGFGMLVYRTTLRHVLKAPELNQMLLTFGIGIVLTNLALQFYGSTPRTLNLEYQGSSLQLWGLSVGYARGASFLLAALMIGLLYTMLTRTRTGKAMQAIAQNRIGAVLIGLEVDRLYLIAFGISSALAGMAGVMVSVLLYASPYVGLVYTLKAFAVIVMAGLGNLRGVIPAALLLGLAEAYVQTYAPDGGGWAEAVFFALIFVALVWRSWRGNHA
jgi:branched-chain amino acid transport system permease protein